MGAQRRRGLRISRAHGCLPPGAQGGWAAKRGGARGKAGPPALSHLPGRCPAAESRVSLSEVELSWSTAQAALKAAASSSMGAARGARARAGGDARAPERGSQRAPLEPEPPPPSPPLPSAPAGARAPGGSRGCHGNGGGGRGARGGGEAGRQRGGGASAGRDPSPAGAARRRALGARPHRFPRADRALPGSRGRREGARRLRLRPPTPCSLWAGLPPLSGRSRKRQTRRPSVPKSA